MILPQHPEMADAALHSINGPNKEKVFMNYTLLFILLTSATLYGAGGTAQSVAQQKSDEADRARLKHEKETEAATNLELCYVAYKKDLDSQESTTKSWSAYQVA